MDDPFFVIACMGPKKINIFIDSHSKLQDLFVKVEEVFSIDQNCQKIIFKGKLLTGRDATLKSFGIRRGDCLMVLGKVTVTEKDNLLQQLDKYEKQYKDEETQVASILTGVTTTLQQARHSNARNDPRLKTAMKGLLSSNEKLMKIIETIDGMEITAPCNEVRCKRKSIVQRIQRLMDQVDSDYGRLQSYVQPVS